jgi:hypothetical protein
MQRCITEAQLADALGLRLNVEFLPLREAS